MDIEYIRGMFDVMSSQYSSEEEMELSDVFKYPKQIEYKSSEDNLSDRCKDLQLRHLWHLQDIEKKLAEFQRCIMPTEGGKNNLFRSVLLQMHIPKGLMPNIVLHQLAEFMTEQVCFFFLKMK